VVDHGVEDRTLPDAIANDTAVVDSGLPDVAPYAGFVYTNSLVAEADDLTAACQAQFGSSWRVANWNDLVALQSGSGDITPLLDAMGMPVWDRGAMSASGRCASAREKCSRRRGNSPDRHNFATITSRTLHPRGQRTSLHSNW